MQCQNQLSFLILLLEMIFCVLILTWDPRLKKEILYVVQFSGYLHCADNLNRLAAAAFGFTKICGEHKHYKPKL